MKVLTYYYIIQTRVNIMLILYSIAMFNIGNGHFVIIRD